MSHTTLLGQSAAEYRPAPPEFAAWAARYRAIWAHILHAAAQLLATAPDTLLDREEIAAIEGLGDPRIAMNAPGHERASRES